MPAPTITAVGASLDFGFCREQSLAASEPIEGSAVHDTPILIALEHPGVWGARALEESDLPDPIKARVRAWEGSVPGARVQLVRREAGAHHRTLFIACTELGRACAVELVLTDLDELLAVDVPAIVAALRSGADVAGARVLTRPRVLVCTNGRRDRCCAKWGVPLYRALTRTGVDVWQTTHLGGHRFAATLLLLPSGVCLGRVALDEVETLAHAITHDEIHRIDRLRGRIALAAHEQAAEAEWRRRTGRIAIDDLVAIESTEREPNAWRVRLRDAAGTWAAIDVAREPTGQTASPSCGKPAGPILRWRYG